MKLRRTRRLFGLAAGFLRNAALQVIPPALLGAYGAFWLAAATGMEFSTAIVLTLLGCAALFLSAFARS
jgi:hypothetical protein